MNTANANELREYYNETHYAEISELCYDWHGGQWCILYRLPNILGERILTEEELNDAESVIGELVNNDKSCGCDDCSEELNTMVNFFKAYRKVHYPETL